MEILKGLRVATLTLGCKVNQYETDAMRELLAHAGVLFVSEGEPADICLINTCSVTQMAEKKSRQLLHRMKKQNPDALVVALGCYVQRAAEEVLADGAVDLVLGNHEKQQICEVLAEAVTARQEEVRGLYCSDIREEREYAEMTISKPGEHTRAYVKIQDGCNQYCTYCIIPYVRGFIRSRGQEEIVEEIRRLVDAGCKEVVLTGIHVSSYGKTFRREDASGVEEDFGNYGGFNARALLDLLHAVDEIEGLERIRLSSLEPRIMTEDFVEGLREIGKLCPHFHLSLQSACNATLKRMNRHYTIEEYMEGVARIRRVFDRPALTTDVIVGFPGETEEEFEVTRENLEKLNLYQMHIFQYSKREGTIAAGMPNQVQESEKKRRSEILLAMTSKQQEAFEASFAGEKVRVLVEECTDAANKCYRGHTERYLEVFLTSEEDVVNRIVEVSL